MTGKGAKIKIFPVHFAGDKAKKRDMVQMAWTFINDRYMCQN